MKQLSILVALITFINGPTFSQQLSGIVNQYTSVNAIGQRCGQTAFEVGNTSGFSTGDLVLIYQAKGATLVSGNTATTGTLSSVNGAGLYEFNRIQLISGNNFTFQFQLKNTYQLSGLIQIVKVVEGQALQLNGNVFPQLWNGSVGGIVAIKSRSLRLNGFSIQANAAGFRGGRRSIDFYLPSLCGTTLYTTDSVSGLAGERGESAGLALINERYGRAPLWAGGGGGNAVNASGGGGGLAGIGGRGGNEWIGCTNYQSNGGLGGLSLLSILQTDSTRLFLGSGGGGGQINNAGGSDGGRGGGIVILIVDTLYGSAGSSITAQGENSQNSAGISGDGTGGGGSGGSVLVQASSIQGPVNINLRGGSSGNVSSNNGGLPCHGTGGGGGGGVLYLSASTQPLTITFSAPGGIPGVNLTSNSNCNNASFGAFAGNPGAVILNRRAIQATTPSSSVIANLLRNYPDTIRTCLSRIVTVNGSVSNGTTVSWTGPNSFTALTPQFSLPSFTAAQQGNYIAIADSSGCRDTVSINIQTDLLPIILPSILPNCPGTNISMTINQQAGIQYAWVLPNGSSFNTASINGIANSNSISGWWKLTRTSAFGCVLTDSVLAPQPVVLDLIFGYPDTINTCLGNSVNVNGQSLNGVTVSWIGPSGFVNNGIQWSLPNLQIGNLGLYTATASQGGCNDTVRVLIKTDLFPFVLPAVPSNLCKNQSISLIVANQPNVNFSWTLPNGQIFNGNSINNVSYSNNLSGWWKISATSLLGCVSIDSLFFPPLSLKLDSVLFGKTISACDGDTLSVPFSLPVGVAAEYLNNLSGSFIPFNPPLVINGIAFPPDNQNVQLKFSYLGCEKLDTLTIVKADTCDEFELFIPNVFTPNDDNLNQNFRAVGTKPIEFRMQIFNRWGQLIFETIDFQNGWDGTHNGTQALQGAYVYVIEYKRTLTSDLIKKSGTLMLLR